MKCVYYCLFLFLSIPAQAAGFISARASAQVGGQSCGRAAIEIEGDKITIECSSLFRSYGESRKIGELTNVSWSSGLTKGRLVAEDAAGDLFWIEVRKSEFGPLKEAVLARL
jgi:hypothetical protein